MVTTAVKFFPDLFWSREKPFQMPKSALIIPSRFIGDNILMLPFIQTLRQALPSYTTLDLVAPPSMLPLFEPLSYFHQVWSEGDPADFLAEQAYDTMFLCRYSFRWALAALGAGVSQRVGFDLNRLGIHGFRRWGHCLTHAVPSTSLFDEKPQREVYLDILKHLNLYAVETSLPMSYPLSETDQTVASRLLKQIPHRPLILIHATAGSPGKKWPMPYWTELIQALKENYQATLLALGTEQDRLHYHTLDLESGVPIFNGCGYTSLGESIAILRQVDLVITLDTAMAHLAALAGTPRLVVLYGPTNEQQWKPGVQPGTFLEQVSLHLPCQPCIVRTCAHKSCTRALSVQHVLQAVERSFQNKVSA